MKFEGVAWGIEVCYNLEHSHLYCGSFHHEQRQIFYLHVDLDPVTRSSQEVHSEALPSPKNLSFKWMMSLLIPNKQIVTEIPAGLPAKQLFNKETLHMSWVSERGEFKLTVATRLHWYRRTELKHLSSSSLTCRQNFKWKKISKPWSFQPKPDYGTQNE